MLTDVGKLLVAGDEESPLALCGGPYVFIWLTAQSLITDVVGVMAATAKQFRKAPRKVFVDLDLQGDSGDRDESLLMEHVGRVGQGRLNVDRLKLRVLADDRGGIVTSREAGDNH